MQADIKELKTDILVIGSGAAGLRTAIELSEMGADFLVIGKSKFDDAHTVLATGGINAALGNMDAADNWLLHAADTLKEGGFLQNYKIAEQLCKEAHSAIDDLVNYGMNFHKEPNGKITQRFFGAALYRRACFSGDETGKEMIRVMVNECKKRKIKFLDNVHVTRIFAKSNKATGIFGINLTNNNFIVIKAKAIILATGGYSRIYKRSSSRIYENYGDGIALAYEAGCELQDMEMVQFHPTGMIWPKEAEGILVTEAVRGEGGKLYNAKNVRFMEKYDPKRKELGPRDEVARAIYHEIEEGRGTEHGGVWLDITHRPKEYLLQRLPKVYTTFKTFLNLDISKQRMEVAPTAHYSMGGIKVKFPSMSTNIKGLLAVGEVTAGVHGANRLGGNSLLECIVFGKHAATSAGKFAKDAEFENIGKKEIENEISKIKSLIAKTGNGTNAEKIRNKIQQVMWDYVGIIRNERLLKTALGKIFEIGEELEKAKTTDAKDIRLLLDAKNMHIPAEAAIRSALLRRESRGAHARSDFEQKDSRYLGNFICKRSPSGNMITKFAKTPAPKGKLLTALKIVENAKYHHLE